MILDEAIKHAEEVAEENQRIVDTGIVFDDVTIDMLCCDDEVIEEHLANYQRCAEEHRQLAEWLKDYKRLKEQEPCEDAISRQAALDVIEREQFKGDAISEIEKLPPVTSQQKIGHWIRVTDKTGRFLAWECDKCGLQHKFATNFCPDCGAKKVES